jgi:hypothetical protein
VRHHFSWKRANMATALCYGTHGGTAQLVFHRQADAWE